MTESDEALKSRFNRETSKIGWGELQRFYARGVVFSVGQSMDLIAVAIALHRDDKQRVEAWLNEELLQRVDDTLAQRWLETDQTVWAVVVAPWVLVQVADDSENDHIPNS